MSKQEYMKYQDMIANAKNKDVLKVVMQEINKLEESPFKNSLSRSAAQKFINLQHQ